MPRSAEVVIADAGPMIALARLDGLHWLSLLFARAWITDTVLSECLAGGKKEECERIRAAVAVGHLRVKSDSIVNPNWTVDAGEASAIAAALELGAGVLMDDRAGRRLAARLGLPVIGVLGVLVLAKRMGLVAKIAPLTAALVNSGYFLSDSVIEQALRLAGETAPHTH